MHQLHSILIECLQLNWLMNLNLNLVSMVTNFFRAIISIGLVLIAYKIYKNNENSLTTIQKILTLGFTLATVIEYLAKTVLYLVRTFGGKVVKLEQGIYLSSAVLDFFEMYASLLGLV